MNLNDLLHTKGINPQHVVVLRHRPYEPKLNKVLPWLAAEKPEVFNAYQQTQGQRLENVMKTMTDTGYVAAFIGHAPGKALFVGLYSIGASRPLNYEEYWQIPANLEMKTFGMEGFTKEESRSSILWFDLALTDFYVSWKGKLIVGWPPPERSWWRRAHRNEIPVLAVLEDSALDAAMPAWDEICLTWEELRVRKRIISLILPKKYRKTREVIFLRTLSVLPTRWKSALSQWRGIYYIFDTLDGKGYIGSAYGGSNLLGRWLDYAASGHGGNRLLRQRDPRHFRFTILQRVSPDMDTGDVIRLEGTWKERLHTRQPYGLNEN